MSRELSPTTGKRLRIDSKGPKVTTKQGLAVSFEWAASMMIDGLREELHTKDLWTLCENPEQAFFDAYDAAHKAETGEHFLVRATCCKCKPSQKHWVSKADVFQHRLDGRPAIAWSPACCRREQHLSREAKTLLGLTGEE